MERGAPLAENQITILIVDSDANYRSNLGSELKNHGYQVSMASSGNKAFELFPTMPFQVVVADMSMANGNGVEMIHSFAEKNIQVPVILTSNDREANAEEMKRLGAADFMFKPLTARDLMEKVRRVRGLPNSFTYFINQRRALVVVSWVGELRVLDSDSLKSCLNEALASPAKFVILNLHGFTGYDAVLAGELVAFQQAIRDTRAWLMLCGLLYINGLIWLLFEWLQQCRYMRRTCTGCRSVSHQSGDV